MRDQFWDLLIQWNKREHGIALISSHVLSELEEHCNQLAVLSQGKCVYSGAAKLEEERGWRIRLESSPLPLNLDAWKAKGLVKEENQLVYPGLHSVEEFNQLLGDVLKQGGKVIEAGLQHKDLKSRYRQWMEVSNE